MPSTHEGNVDEGQRYVHPSLGSHEQLTNRFPKKRTQRDKPDDRRDRSHSSRKSPQPDSHPCPSERHGERLPGRQWRPAGERSHFDASSESRASVARDCQPLRHSGDCFETPSGKHDHEQQLSSNDSQQRRSTESETSREVPGEHQRNEITPPETMADLDPAQFGFILIDPEASHDDENTLYWRQQRHAHSGSAAEGSFSGPYTRNEMLEMISEETT